MTALNKQALREAAERAASDSWGYDRDEFNDAITPEVALALLDELEAAEKRVAELEAREVRLPEAMMPARHNSGELFMSPDNVEYGGYLNRDDVVRVLRAAGIITKVGE